MSSKILYRNRQYTDVMLEYMPIGVALLHAHNLCLLAANSLFESLLDPLWQNGNALGHPPTEWLPETEAERLVTILHRVAQSGKTYRANEEAIPPLQRGQTCLRWTIEPVYDENGQILHLVAAASKISPQTAPVQLPLEKENAQIQEAIEQYKRDFLSIASHELRTPVTAIQGLAEILQLQASRGQNLDASRNLDAINRISEQSKRLSRLIEEILDLSRIERAQLHLQIAQHDLLQTLTQVFKSYEENSKRHKFSLVVEGLTATDTLTGCYDEERVSQVIGNLLSNAVKFSPQGGLIEVGIRYDQTSPDEVIIWVKDQGIGIAQENLPFIFSRFYRASNVDRSISGLGIGLYVARELVNRHSGRIWAESIEGQGSTFFVRLPLQASISS